MTVGHSHVQSEAATIEPANAGAFSGHSTPFTSKRADRRLIALLILPGVAMYGTFQGLQQIMIPAQMEAMDPVNKVANLGLLTTLSAIAAVISLPMGGAVSDRTHSRWGRRTPWLALMALASAVLMILMSHAVSLPAFACIYIALWFTANFYQGALTAVLPDRIPPENRGIASAMVGLSVPIGIVFGVNIAARADTTTSYAIIAAALVALTAVFLLFAPEGPYRRQAASPAVKKMHLSHRIANFFGSFRSRDFTFAFLSRALLFIAYFSVSGFLFYFVQDRVGLATLPERSVKVAISILSTVNMIAWIGAIFISGWLADRLQRHKLIVGISAVGRGLSLIVPIISPDWHGMLLYSILNGMFFGTYMAIDMALMSFVLPEEEAAGRDMGLLAVATAAPQLVSPAISGGLFLTFGYSALYMFGAIMAVAAGVSAFFIRGVR